MPCWHPDRNPENVKEATQRFAEISAARDLLSIKYFTPLEKLQVCSESCSQYSKSLIRVHAACDSCD